MCSDCEKCTTKFQLVSFALSLHNAHTMTSCFRCLTGGRRGGGGGGGGRGGGFRGGSCCSSLLLLTDSWSLVSPGPLTLNKHLFFHVQQQLVQTHSTLHVGCEGSFCMNSTACSVSTLQHMTVRRVHRHIMMSFACVRPPAAQQQPDIIRL